MVSSGNFTSWGPVSHLLKSDFKSVTKTGKVTSEESLDILKLIVPTLLQFFYVKCQFL